MASALASWLLVALVAVAHGQTDGGAFQVTALCNGTFADANAAETGLYNIDLHVDQGPQKDQPDNRSGKSRPIGVAFTVAENTNTSELELSVWANPRGANFSDDFGLGYDLCAMAFSYIPENTILRGQNDNGSCYQTFDESCVNAVKTAANNYALELTFMPSPGPNSNLTVDSLPTVCNDIATYLTTEVPALKECSPYVNGSFQVAPNFALTGYNASLVYSQNCIANGSYHLLQTQFLSYTADLYAYATQLISPVLAIAMPIANADRPSSIQYSTSQLICARAGHINPGSEVPAAAASPTPVSAGGSGDGLSGGAIAGIVVGCVVGVALIVGLIAWRRIAKRRKSRNAMENNTSGMDNDGLAAASLDSDEKKYTQETHGAGVAELPPGQPRPELDGGKDNAFFELDPNNQAAKELPAEGSNVNGLAVELEGSAPRAE